MHGKPPYIYLFIILKYIAVLLTFLYPKMSKSDFKGRF